MTMNHGFNKYIVPYDNVIESKPLQETMMNNVRKSRHGKACKPRQGGDNPSYTAETLRRGVTAQQLVASGRATTVRQARRILRYGDRQAAAA